MSSKKKDKKVTIRLDADLLDRLVRPKPVNVSERIREILLQALAGDASTT